MALPITSTQRIMKLVEKSAPRKRPLLPPEFEDQLRAVHASSAACYASMEDLGDKLEHLAAAIDSTPVEVSLSDAGIVEDTIENEISVVTHIDDVREELRTSQSRALKLADHSDLLGHTG